MSDLRDLLRDQCPTLEQLGQLFDGRLRRDDELILREHIIGCQACSAEWQAMSEFAAAEPEQHEKADVAAIVEGLKNARQPQPVSQASWWSWASVSRWAGAAAVLLLAVAVGIQWQRSQRTSDEFGVSGQLRSAGSVEVANRGALSSVPSKLEWKPVTNATSYQLVISEVDGTELWRGVVTIPELLLPESVRKVMLPNKTLHWRVVALGANSEKIADSGIVEIRVVP